MQKRIEVGVLGATGMVGQQFINQLASHPWFSLSWLAASERSEGKRYSEAAPWRLDTPIPEGVGGRNVEACTPGKGPKLVFSALDASVAGEIEKAFADAGHVVVSNSRNHRMDPTCRCWYPRSTPTTSHLLARQRDATRLAGSASSPTPTAPPSCSTMALAPLRPFGLRSVPRHHHAGGLRAPASRACPRSTSSAT